MHVRKLFLCCFDDSCGIFEKLAVFCKFRVLEQLSGSMRRAPLRRGVRLIATEAGASLRLSQSRAPQQERRGTSVQRRAPLYSGLRLCAFLRVFRVVTCASAPDTCASSPCSAPL